MIKKLRAHHLICISRHNEKENVWYNEKFHKFFKKIFKSIIQNPYQKIEIKRECDDLCKKCPHFEKTICNKPSEYNINHWLKVADNKTIRLIKSNPGEILSAKEFLKRICLKIKNKELKNICKGCEFLSTCLKAGINKKIK